MRKNIIWVTLDSVRADHTTMAGYQRDTTPQIQRIANLDQGQYFSQCISSGMGTPSASASILTGTHPSHHGLKMTSEYLPHELDTAPELLQKVGYQTAGLSRNSYLSSGTGLNRGFERFEWIAGSTLSHAVPMTILARYLRNLRRHSAGFTTNTAKHATPFLLNAMAERWLTDLRDSEPFFLYLHYNETHRPYFPPLPYLDRYTENLPVAGKEAAERAMEIHHNTNQIIADGYTLSETDEMALESMYDAELTYTDAQIGTLFDTLRSTLDDFVFVVTADHGEFFGEHGLLAHKISIDDAVVHVPLVTYGIPDVSHQADEIVQHIDVMRTLLEYADADTDQTQGIDLRAGSREYAISQRGPVDLSMYNSLNSEFDTATFQEPFLTAFRTTQFEYQYCEEGDRLYELPKRETDVSGEYPKVAAKFRDEVNTWLKTDGQPVGSTRKSNLTESMRGQLRRLGYVE